MSSSTFFDIAFKKKETTGLEFDEIDIWDGDRRSSELRKYEI